VPFSAAAADLRSQGEIKRDTGRRKKKGESAQRNLHPRFQSLPADTSGGSGDTDVRHPADSADWLPPVDRRSKAILFDKQDACLPRRLEVYLPFTVRLCS